MKITQINTNLMGIARLCMPNFLKPYSLKDIIHIHGFDHPESSDIGTGGKRWPTGV